jgi:hypothetical protein
MLEVFKEANTKSTEKKEDPLSPLQERRGALLFFFFFFFLSIV